MRSAFTLVELMVVVTIIVILIALLTPGMDKAVKSAQKAKCLANVRNTTQGVLSYAIEQKKHLPVWKMVIGGVDEKSSAYDLRATWDNLVPNAAKYPMGIGLLVPAGFLPATQLGRVIHCPSMDNSSGVAPGHCMDWPVHGGSYWVENPNYRIIGAYNYRAASYWNLGKGDLRFIRLRPNLALYVDVPDVRFRGRKGIYVHPDGYNVAFSDGSGIFRFDPRHQVNDWLLAKEPSGIMHGGIGGFTQAEYEEEAWRMLEHPLD